MKAVWYYEMIRRKNNYIHMLWVPVIMLFVIFLLAFIVDAVFPTVNRLYMKWPDMVKDLLSLPAWSGKLYVNLWQLFAIVYPIFFLYSIAKGLASSIIEEERLETVVYLQNMSVNRLQLMLGKMMVWCTVMSIILVVLFVESTILFLVLGAGQMLKMLAEYYFSLFFVGILYVSFAVFLASYKKREVACEDTISAVMIFTILLARIYTLIQFLSDIFVSTGRQGAITEQMDVVADKLRILTIVSPVTWCWPGVPMRTVYVVCGMIIALILVFCAGYIYQQRIYMEEE